MDGRKFWDDQSLDARDAATPSSACGRKQYCQKLQSFQVKYTNQVVIELCSISDADRGFRKKAKAA